MPPPRLETNGVPACFGNGSCPDSGATSQPSPQRAKSARGRASSSPINHVISGNDSYVPSKVISGKNLEHLSQAWPLKSKPRSPSQSTPRSLTKNQSLADVVDSRPENRTPKTPRKIAKKSRILVGGFQVGDRINGGSKGLGTVEGVADTPGLASLAVNVLWDSGRHADERVHNLQLCVAPVPKYDWKPEMQVDTTVTLPISLGVFSPPSAKVSNRSRLGKDTKIDSEKEDRLKGKWMQYSRTASVPATTRRDSQLEFAYPHQTLIFFDWDDTLYPTNYLLHELKLIPDQGFVHQPRLLGSLDEVSKKVADCEAWALKALQRACQLGHVIVLTAAGQFGWVERACQWCYHDVGKFIKEVNISIVYAQNSKFKVKAKAAAKSSHEFWGLVKGHAISEEITKFYSQYEGQSWKNVLSIGDSSFERYGLISASTAYMQERRLSSLDQTQPYLPMEASEWQKVNSLSHLVRLRVKVCKLVRAPDALELKLQLELVTKWLRLIVQFDSGLDLNFDDLEGEQDITLVESVLRGRRPISHLPCSAAK